jgi:hypothetical protein
MFIFATPANRLFPLYLAMLGLSAWSAGALLRQADVAAFGALFSARTPVRGIAVYMWTAVALNAAAWLARIIPAVARGGTPAYLRGTGLTVNVVYVQDLALWLPLLAVAAAWLWRRPARDRRRVPGRPAAGGLDRGAAADPAAVLLPAAGHRGHRRRRGAAGLALATIRADRHPRPGTKCRLRPARAVTFVPAGHRSRRGTMSAETSKDQG